MNKFRNAKVNNRLSDYDKALIDMMDRSELFIYFRQHKTMMKNAPDLEAKRIARNHHDYARAKIAKIENRA